MQQQLDRVCRFFMEDTCEKETCKFIHDPDLCYYFWANGHCRDGSRCRWNHYVNTENTSHKAAQKKIGNRNNNNNVRANPNKGSSSQRPTSNTGAKSDEYGAPIQGRNTENFLPCHDPPTLRVVVDPTPTTLSVTVRSRDIVLAPCLFNRPGDETMYQTLVSEIENCTIPQDVLLKSWHGDTHWIADDSTGWKKQCPTFVSVVDRLRDYFKMDIKATRFNWYKDTSEWKPFHHDAAAVKPDKAKTQNFTVGVSFGATREAAFEEVQSKKVVSFPLPNGSVYCFARDVNIMWKHGILQLPPEKQTNEGRISIIAWGWLEQLND